MGPRRQVPGVLGVWLALALIILSVASNRAFSAESDELRVIRSLVEGIYTLEESHSDGKMIAPPLVEGRVAYLNGATMFIFHNRAREGSQVSLASWGDYTLSDTEFAYRYTEPSAVTVTPTGVTHARRIPWEGYRAFTVKREGDNVRMTGKTVPQQLLFSPTSLVFIEGDPASPSARRVYRRVVRP